MKIGYFSFNQCVKGLKLGAKTFAITNVYNDKWLPMFCQQLPMVLPVSLRQTANLLVLQCFEKIIIKILKIYQQFG